MGTNSEMDLFMVYLWKEVTVSLKSKLTTKVNVKIHFYFSLRSTFL